ncbi:MAG TPA: hypothetical protein VFW87_14550, partial [Pirellulales bacterium]|nr:hypothetical protein [Pirellulales bacterium]
RQIELRCRTDPPRDLPAKFVLPAELILCKVDLSLARARLARACGDSVAEQHALHSAADDAAALRKSSSAFRPPLFLSLGLGPVIAHRRASDLEIALARAERDQDAEQAARDRWARFLTERRQQIACDSMGALILSCYSIVLQYDQQGAAIFDRPVSELAIARG